jgi:hypothetical protein
MYNVGAAKCTRSDAAHERAILSIRSYMQIMVLLNGLFVIIIGSVCPTVVFQLRKYDVVSSENINSMATNAMTIMSNAARMSASAVPIMDNAQFVTDSLVAALAAAVNASQVNNVAVSTRQQAGASQDDAASAAGRRLFSYPGGGDSEAGPIVDANDVLNLDLKMRQTMYKLSRSLLQTANHKLEEFNPAAVSDLLEWVVRGVNYTGIATRFDRVLYDVEKTANFGALATSMLGIAAAAANVTVPTTSQLLDTFHKHQAAAVEVNGGGAGHQCP